MLLSSRHLCLRVRSHVRYAAMPVTVAALCVAIFAARCYASAAYAVMRCLSVCLSVCHVREFCKNEQPYLQFFFHRRIVKPYPVMAIFRQGTPPPRGRRLQVGYAQIAILDEQRAIDRWLLQCAIDSRRCSSVSQLRRTSVYGTETATHQWIRRRDEKRT